MDCPICKNSIPVLQHRHRIECRKCNSKLIMANYNTIFLTGFFILPLVNLLCVVAGGLLGAFVGIVVEIVLFIYLYRWLVYFKIDQPPNQSLKNGTPQSGAP